MSYFTPFVVTSSSETVTSAKRLGERLEGALNFGGTVIEFEPEELVVPKPSAR